MELRLCFVRILGCDDHDVQRGTSLSDAGKVRSGVPQGSIIVPFVFTLFYNDLPSCLKHSEVSMYADDTVIFVPGKDAVIVESWLSADMKRVYRRIVIWYLEKSYSAAICPEYQF